MRKIKLNSAKLQLKKETVDILIKEEMTQLHGGYSPTPTCATAGGCPTWVNCSSTCSCYYTCNATANGTC